VVGGGGGGLRLDLKRVFFKIEFAGAQLGSFLKCLLRSNLTDQKKAPFFYFTNITTRSKLKP